jgi:hypothetical protein
MIDLLSVQQIEVVHAVADPLLLVRNAQREMRFVVLAKRAAQGHEPIADETVA